LSDVTDLTEEEASEDQFQIIPMPEISIVESRMDVNNPKSHDNTDSQFPTCNLKISAAQSLNKFSSYDFNNQPNNQDFPTKSSNEIAEIANEVSERGITMLSSTSLLHGSCVFNRNNTVATQAGLKTYWLCKSYRISMCKARCITFKGKVISATGIHNHLAHMSNKSTEIPPGHTPNIFNPLQTPEFPMNYNTLPSSQLHHESNQQPYSFLPPPQTLPIPGVDISQFKIEHI
jgi:FLYWCH zinc finger domain